MLDSETRRELVELEMRCIDGRIEILKLMDKRDRIFIWVFVAMLILWIGVIALRIELSSVKKQLPSAKVIQEKR